MDKRYQVFISSTFLDLREERQAVSQALLRSDCFPAQMENWPAMDAEQMEAIKQIIDESDYYLVISAGKYGSINPETGLSYTEMEYDYAMSIGKPIIRLLHRDPFNALRGDQIEDDAGVRQKLESFHGKLKTGSVCSFWENADHLEKETVFALLDVKKRKPAAGWVKATKQASSELEAELAKAKQKIAEIELKAATDANALFDLDAIFKKLTGETTILHSFFVGDQNHPRRFIGPPETRSLTYLEAELAELATICALGGLVEYELRRNVGYALSRVAWNDRALMSANFDEEWKDADVFQKLLAILEAEGVLDSVIDTTSYASDVVTWQVAETYRRQVRGLSVGWKP